MPSARANIALVPKVEVGMGTEADRLTVLGSFEILDTPSEAAFDALASLAAHLCAAPTAMVTLVDADRQWFKARHGYDLTQTSRERSFCAHALGGADLLEVPDARLDPRFAGNPSVTGDPFVRFYAGAPLITRDGYVLGTLCVLDTEPRTLDDAQRAHLDLLAAQVVDQLELRRQARSLATEMQARQVADVALRNSQRMLAGVLEHTDVLIYAKDLDGRYVMTNPAFERVTTLDGGVLQHTDHELFGPAEADAFCLADNDIVVSRQRQVFNEELDHPDGNTHTYRSTKFPLLDDAGEVIGIGGVSMDVTELAAARAAHEEAEQRWRDLVEQTPVGVAVIGADGVVEYANPHAVLLCGASTAAEVEHRSALDFISADARADTRAMLAKVLAGGPPIRARTWYLRQLGGTLLTVEFSASAVTHRGAPALQLELRDITEAAVAQAELTESERRFRAVAAVARCVHTGEDPRHVAVAAVRELSGASTVSMVEATETDTLVVTASDGLDVVGLTTSLGASSMTAHVWQTREAVFLPDASTDPRVDKDLLALDDSVSCLWQPVIVEGTVEAILNVTWRRSVADVAERARRAVQLIADETGVALQTIRLRAELERSAATDPLTGTLNRRAWHSRLQTLLEDAGSTGAPLTIAIVDLDNFKAYNDTHGHVAGDAVLRTFASAARDTLRHDDVFARWGGEEFILALPGTTAEQAAVVLERVRSCVPTPQTCSIGYTTWRITEPVTNAVARADDALYRAKDLGRDQLARA